VSDVVIRQALASDAPALVELARQVSAEPEGWLIAAGESRGAGDERRFLRSIRRSPHAAVFVAEARAGIVFPYNEAAIALYERFGFEKEGYRHGHYRSGGRLVDAILMAYEVER
jgi:hypothetical protein